MATEVVKTLRASGGHYSTYAAWDAGEDRDLTALDEIAVCEMYHDWATGLSNTTTIGAGASWVCSTDCYIHLRPAPGHKHNGQFYVSGTSGNFTGASLVSTGTNPPIQTNRIGTRISGMIASHEQSTSSARYAIQVGSTGAVAEGNLCQCFSTGAGSAALRHSSNNQTVSYNNVARMPGTTGNAVRGDGSNSYSYNDTAIGGNYAFNFAVNGLTVLNGLGYGGNTADFNFAVGTYTVQNSAATDASLPGGSGNRNSQTFTFVSPANLNFRLDPADTGATGHGQDLSAISIRPFSTDIMGATRSAPWDIGAFKADTGTAPTGDTEISVIAPTPDGVTIDIDDSDVSGADGFEYQLGTAGVWTDMGDAPPFTATGLDPLTNYQIRVAPYNEHGRGTPSNLVSFRTLADLPIYDKQDHSAEVGTVTGDPITLPGEVDEARTYAIYRAPGDTWAVHALSQDWERGAPAADLEGDAVAAAEAAGALSTAIPLAGAAITLTTATGTVTTIIPLIADAIAIATAGGNLATQIRLDGAALVAALATAGLGTQILLQGSAAASAGASGNLDAAAIMALAGDAAALAAADGNLATAIRLAAAAAATANATGMLSAANAELAGAALAAALATGELTIQIRLAGDAVAAVVAQGDLATAGEGLFGHAAVTAAAGGNLSTAIPLAGAALVATNASGELARIIDLAGAAASVVTGLGSLDTAIRLRGASIIAALSAASLTARIQFQGAALVSASAQGHLGSGLFSPAPARTLRTGIRNRTLRESA